MILKKLGLLVTVAFLAGCVENSNAVSDYNGASVKITGHQWETDGFAKASEEASRICIQGGKSRAEPASQRMLPNYMKEYLFLCL